MARYGITTEEKAPASPVNFDHEFFNHQMRYNNGIFVIDNPGYYRIDFKSYYNKETFNNETKYVHFKLMINNMAKQHQYSRFAAPAFDSIIVYLDAFDTVFISLGSHGDGTLCQGATMNNIQIEKIYWYIIYNKFI